MSEMNPVDESADPSETLSEAGTTTAVMTPPPPPPNKRRRIVIAVIAILLLLLLLVAAAFAWFAITKKPLTQLPLLSEQIPPHYSATFYDVTQPIGVAVDEPNERIYVTQSAGDRNVAVFDLSGNRKDPLVAPGGANALHTPVYVAVNPTTSDVYVSDRATGKVYVYDVTGKYLRDFQPTGVKVWQPLGLWFDPQGNLYVTNVMGPKQKAMKIAADGTVLQTYGVDDALSFPNGVATNSDNSVFVTDSNHSRVLMYQPDGTLIGALPRGTSETQLGLPRGISVDDRGRIYIVDTTNQNVQVFTPGDGPTALPTYAFTFGEEGTTEGTFEYPNGVAVDSHGRIYITDRENNRLQVWSY